jgi:hypothetical protein
MLVLCQRKHELGFYGSDEETKNSLDDTDHFTMLQNVKNSELKFSTT